MKRGCLIQGFQHSGVADNPYYSKVISRISLDNLNEHGKVNIERIRKAINSGEDSESLIQFFNNLDDEKLNKYVNMDLYQPNFSYAILKEIGHDNTSNKGKATTLIKKY